MSTTAKKRHRSFAQARKFARALKLKGSKEWRIYCTGKLRGYKHKRKPKDIPANPNVTYKNKGWQGYGDWLGTGAVAPKNRVYFPFTKARKFARSLKLKSNKEWRLYCTGQLKGYKRRPKDIPANPNIAYKNKGWQSYGDWLGTGIIAPKNRVYLPFTKARKFIHSLDLKSDAEWRLYCTGRMGRRKSRPQNIPAHPDRVYKDKGWKSLGDWLGTGTVAPKDRAYLSFRRARDFVHALNLKNEAEWRRYCTGRLYGYGPKPEDIPTHPDRVYRDKGWQGYGNWLGTETLDPVDKVYRSFTKASSFVRSLKWKGQKGQKG